MKSCMMKTAALTVLMIALTWGCAQDQEAGQETGAVLVMIDQSLARSSEDTFSPNRSLNLDSFILKGSGPMGEVFETHPFSDDEVLIEHLPIGTWHMELLGYSQEDLLAYDEAYVEICMGTITAWEAVLLPIEGTGSIQISMTWPQELFSDPSVEASLYTDHVSFASSLSADASEGSAEITGEDIDCGYYILKIFLKEHGNTVWGDIFTVRIITDLVTEGEVDIMEDQLTHEGKLGLQISPQFYEPLDVSISGLPFDAEQRTLTLSAEGALHPDVILAYYWYLDGELLLMASSETIKLSDTLAPGHYQLTGVVLALDVDDTVVQAGHSGVILEIPE